MRPMLAAPMPADGVDYPHFASAKLDGIRAVVKDGKVLTRKLEPLPNLWVQQVLGHPLLEGLDGELIVGAPYADDVFNVTQSAVMSVQGKPDFMFHVFDYWNGAAETQPYGQRYSLLVDAFAMHEYITHPYIALLEQVWITETAQLAAMQEDHLERGYEGLILRNPDQGYKFGRSTDNLNAARHSKTGQPLQPWTMLKLKKFSSGEARIVGFKELMTNTNEREEDALGLSKRGSSKEFLVPAGVLGALEVEDCATGVRFGIGSGFDAQERADLWALAQSGKLTGRIARYKHFEVGVKTAPRFPIFQGFRDERDMGDPS